MWRGNWIDYQIANSEETREAQRNTGTASETRAEV